MEHVLQIKDATTCTNYYMLVLQSETPFPRRLDLDFDRYYPAYQYASRSRHAAVAAIDKLQKHITAQRHRRKSRSEFA